MKTICILASLTLLTPAAALAAPEAKPQAAAAASATGVAAAAATPEKLICRRDYSTGSRTNSHSNCMTKKQWRAYDRGGEDELRRELQRR